MLGTPQPLMQIRVKSLVFICRENPSRSGILLFPDRPSFCQLMKTRNRRYPRSSGMNRDKSGESGAIENSNLCLGDVGNGFRSVPIPYIAGLQSPYHIET